MQCNQCKYFETCKAHNTLEKCDWSDGYKPLKERYLRHLVFESDYALEDYVNGQDNMDILTITTYTDSEMDTHHVLWYWFHTNTEK